MGSLPPPPSLGPAGAPPPGWPGAAAAAMAPPALGGQLPGFTPLLGGLMSPLEGDPVGLAFAAGADPQLASFVGKELARMK